MNNFLNCSSGITGMAAELKGVLAALLSYLFAVP